MANVGAEAPVRTTPTVLQMSSALKKTVAKLASASSRQQRINVLMSTIQFAAVIIIRSGTHVMLLQSTKGTSSPTANVKVTVEILMMVVVCALVTMIVYVTSTVTSQMEIVGITIAENACRFLLCRTVSTFWIIKCAAVITSSTRIHAQPIKAGRAFEIRANASLTNLLLSKSLTRTMLTY